jgi:S1-C subfamily serine protease
MEIIRTMPTLLQRLNDRFSDVVESVWPSLVKLQVGGGRGAGAGAGTIWHSDGLVMTNAHVVQRGPVEVVLVDGRRFPARLIAQDEGLDVAALSIAASGLPTIPLSESTALRPGQLVMAAGHPWGVEGAVATGVVIGGGGQFETTPDHRELVAISLNLRPGNSGGPLTDARGRLVGINAMVTGPEVGLAVPVHVVKRFLKNALGTKAA